VTRALLDASLSLAHRTIAVRIAVLEELATEAGRK